MLAKWLSRFVLVVAFIGIINLFCDVAYSREVSVFSVNKNLQLNPQEPVYHDYYISGGTEQGFRTGMQVTAVRRVPVHDLSRNRALGDLRLPIAKLKLIFVQRGMSVARLTTLLGAKNTPIVDFNGVMVGDTISLGNGLDAGGVMEVNDEGEGTKGPSEGAAEPAPSTEGQSTSSAPVGDEPEPLTADEITKNLTPKEKPVDVSDRSPATSEKPEKTKSGTKESKPKGQSPDSQSTQLGPKA